MVRMLMTAILWIKVTVAKLLAVMKYILTNVFWIVGLVGISRVNIIYLMKIA